MISFKSLFGPKVSFETVADDDDELTRAIQKDPISSDNDWDLHEDVDGQALEAFWDQAARDTLSEGDADQH